MHVQRDSDIKDLELSNAPWQKKSAHTGKSSVVHGYAGVLTHSADVAGGVVCEGYNARALECTTPEEFKFLKRWVLHSSSARRKPVRLSTQPADAELTIDNIIKAAAL
jgi:hypothetical protein